jgi:membrane-associated phospholipid phosphatase
METNPVAKTLQGSTTPQEARQETQRHRRALFQGRGLIALGGGILVLFVLVTLLVVVVDPLTLDVPITREVQELTNIGPLSSLLVDVSLPGFAPWNYLLPVLIMLVMVLVKRGAEALFLMLATICTGVGEVVKTLVHRARPSATLVNVIHNTNLDGSSFPSSHVIEYTLVCGFCFYLVYTLMKHGPPRTFLLVILGAMVVLIGPSRILMGQHWASDVLGGYALGFGLLMLVIWAYRGWEARRVKHPPPVTQA